MNKTQWILTGLFALPFFVILILFFSGVSLPAIVVNRMELFFYASLMTWVSGVRWVGFLEKEENTADVFSSLVSFNVLVPIVTWLVVLAMPVREALLMLAVIFTAAFIQEVWLGNNLQDSRRFRTFVLFMYIPILSGIGSALYTAW